MEQGGEFLIASGMALEWRAGDGIPWQRVVGPGHERMAFLSRLRIQRLVSGMNS